MSVLALFLYREENGTQHNPAVSVAAQNTNYTLNGVSTPKPITEVFIKYITSAWVEQSGWVTGSVVVRKMVNPSTGLYVYAVMPLTDLQSIQNCCIS